MPSLRPKGGGDNPFARARGASPPPPPVTRFLNNLNKITISATVMNDDDRLSYLPVSRCVDVGNTNHPKTISDPKAVAAESGVLLSKPKAPSLFTMRILVRSTSGDWDIRDMKCQI